MARDDWYRRDTWTVEDRTDFAARLKRTQKHTRPQYLRIQAVHLADAGVHEATLELLDDYFASSRVREPKLKGFVQQHRAHGGVGTDGLTVG